MNKWTKAKEGMGKGVRAASLGCGVHDLGIQRQFHGIILRVITKNVQRIFKGREEDPQCKHSGNSSNSRRSVDEVVLMQWSGVGKEGEEEVEREGEKERKRDNPTNTPRHASRPATLAHFSMSHMSRHFHVNQIKSHGVAL